MPSISLRELTTPTSAYCYEYHRLFKALQHFDEDDLAVLLRRLSYRDFLRTHYWRAVAAHIRLIAKFRCARCRRKRSRLDVHHLSYAHHGREHLFTSDLVALCPWCHDAKHHHPFWWHERLLKLRCSKALPPEKRVIPFVL